MMSLWDALRMNMMISYQELVRTFLNSVNKVNVKSKVKNSYISRSVNDEFSLTDDEINSFKETLVLSSIDSLSKLVLNNPLSVLFTSTVRRNNNRAKMNVEFDSWICTRCC
ncbi:hypothetical protein E4K60_23980 [Escherichia coli]|nr:hypothetical protein [Escherichia coli]